MYIYTRKNLSLNVVKSKQLWIVTTHVRFDLAPNGVMFNWKSIITIQIWLDLKKLK